jgi:hypothetical protein
LLASLKKYSLWVAVAMLERDTFLKGAGVVEYAIPESSWFQLILFLKPKINHTVSNVLSGVVHLAGRRGEGEEGEEGS